MKAKRLTGNGSHSFVLVFDKGDEVIGELDRFAKAQRLSAASFTGIGAFSDAVIGYFDRERKGYDEINIDDQVEVLSLAGDVALADGEPKVHAHVVLGERDGNARGGHLLRAHVWPTLELVLSESPAELRKRYDAETGLPLIETDEEAAGR